MAYLGLLTYCVLLFIRPSDWVAAVLNWPLEAWVVTLSLIFGIVRYKTSEYPHRGGLGVMVAMLVGWVVCVFLSNAVHGNMSDAVTFTIDFGKRALVATMFWLVIDSTRKMRWFSVVFVVVIAALGWQGIYMVEHGYGWAGQPMYWGGRIRWIGMWDGANVLSLIFVTAIPFVLEMVLGPWPFIGRIVAAASGGLILTGMGYAASRGAGQALVLVLLFYFKKRLGAIGFGIGGVAVLGLLLVAPARFTHLETDDGSIDAESSNERIDMWAQGLEMFKYNPVFGIGKGRYASYTGSLIAHNAFIQNLGETGFVGVTLWLGLIYYPIKRLRKVLEYEESLSPHLRSMARAVLLSFVGYLAASMFISTDLEPLYILMALSGVMLDIARHETGEPMPVSFGVPDIAGIMCMTSVGIVGMYILVRLLGS